MKKFFSYSAMIGSLAALTTRCGNMPLKADELREAVPGAFTGEVETFEVDRPFDAVVRTFEEI